MLSFKSLVLDVAGAAAAGLLVSASPALGGAAAPALTPLPKAGQISVGRLEVRGDFQVVWDGARSPFLDRALARFQRDADRLTGEDGRTDPGPVLHVRCATDRLDLAKDSEAYSLEVTSQGVSLTAATPVGVLHGLATLRQLLDASPPDAGLPLVRIDDAPRFAWRGLMIDTARHFMPIEALKRQIDAMEAVKLNVLHLHLSDNEAFRVESRRYPKLQAVASGGRYYSQAEIRDLVAYAADRGVRIVPEFDAPAHVGAILEAYPDLAAPQAAAAGPFAGMDQALDPTSEATYRFLAGLYGEMVGLFPDADFHIGGDEVQPQAWAAPALKAFMQAHGLVTTAQLQAVFERRVIAMLRADGKIPIGWEEASAGVDPASGLVVQAWRTSNSTAAAVGAGFPTIVSAGYYLDNLTEASRLYAVDPFDPDADGFTPEEARAAGRYGPLAAAVVAPLTLKPLPPLTPAEQARIVGGEGALWSELVDGEMLDGRLWPRAAALAERFWSPAGVRDPADLYRRLAIAQDELRRLGLEDQADQARMAERLAPGDASPVLTLLGAVEPVRNAAHNHAILAMLRGQLHPPPQALTTLADTAFPESLAARRFEAEARAFVAGDHSGAPMLAGTLSAWRDNDAAFQAAARGRPVLEAALPVSADVATLAQAGLDAVQALEAGRPMAADDLARARAALAKADAQAAASARPIFAFVNPQPPADLIIAIAPGVRTLVEAAAR